MKKSKGLSMRYQITSDSTCDLSPEQLEQYHIRLLPLYVSMDGKTLRDGVDVKPDDIYAHVSAGGSLPQTAAVNLADYVRAFTELSKKNDFVIHVCISLDFSCCYQNAKLAAADFDNVYVVDSRNLSTGHGLVVLEAERMAREGMAPDDIVAETVCSRYMEAFDGKNIDALIMGCTHYPVYRPALEKRLPGVRMIDVGEALAEALRPLFAESGGTGAVEYCVTERSAAFDEIVRVMDPSLDPAAIRVENAFIQ